MPAAVANSAPNKPTKKKRRQRKRGGKAKGVANGNNPKTNGLLSQSPSESQDEEVVIEYIADKKDFENSQFSELSSVFNKFLPPEELTKEKQATPTSNYEEKKEDTEGNKEETNEATAVQNEALSEKKLSRRERKRQKQLEVAVLKQLVRRPDLVEVHDVNSPDPLLHLNLKSYRNSVQVPRHWSQKRKYLQGKRGIEKPPFRLPDFIQATGISRIRDAVAESDDAKSLKQATRERMNPRMGKLDIDYQVLHDAFFKYQTKPKLTMHGDLYYECKEFEVNMQEKIPGILSQELKTALGMGEGSPPPWLINQQRYGPPPSYPKLKIPGLNAPIPPGAQFGYHPGGWGKPPVDELGRPLYGDVFGTAAPEPPPEITAPIEYQHWGELEEEEYESSEEEESKEEEEEEEEELGEKELQEGIQSIQSGMATPETISLRKEKKAPAKPLFQVLEEKEAKVGSALYGSSTKYVVPGSAERVDLMKSQKGDKVDITLNPTELSQLEEGLTEDMLKKKYKEQLEKQKSNTVKEDVSDIIAEQERKRKRQAAKDQDRKAKKYKEFKF